MMPVPPHHLLSAYLDGELSSDEREEVEHLLAGSPAARQELQELQHIGALLRQLPPQSLPKSFPAQVLEGCLSDTGQFETETQAEMPSALVGPAKADSPQQARWWRSVAGLGFSLAAVALVLVLVLPDPANHPPHEVATHSPDAAENVEAERSPADRSPDDRQELAMAPANGKAAEEFNEAVLPQEADKEPQRARDIPSVSLASRPPADPIQQSVPGQNAGGFGGAAGQPVERVAVVKVYVGDRQQGLDNLKELLQRQHILRDETAPAKPGESTADGQPDSQVVAVYVETTEDQLEKALETLQKDKAIQHVKQEAPIAVAQLDSLLKSAERKPRLSRFGGGGGAGLSQPAAPLVRGFRAARMSQPRPGAKSAKNRPEKSDATKTAKPKEAQEKTPKPEAVPEAKPEAAKKAPAPRIRVAGPSPELNKLRSGLSRPKRFRTQESEKMEDRELVNRRTRQKQFTLPKAVLEQLQKESPEAETPQKKSKDRSNNAPARAGKRVQVLFILMDQPAK